MKNLLAIIAIAFATTAWAQSNTADNAPGIIKITPEVKARLQSQAAAAAVQPTATAPVKQSTAPVRTGTDPRVRKPGNSDAHMQNSSDRLKEQANREAQKPKVNVHSATASPGKKAETQKKAEVVKATAPVGQTPSDLQKRADERKVKEGNSQEKISNTPAANPSSAQKSEVAKVKSAEAQKRAEERNARATGLSVSQKGPAAATTPAQKNK